MDRVSNRQRLELFRNAGFIQEEALRALASQLEVELRMRGNVRQSQISDAQSGDTVRDIYASLIRHVVIARQNGVGRATQMSVIGGVGHSVNGEADPHPAIKKSRWRLNSFDHKRQDLGQLAGSG